MSNETENDNFPETPRRASVKKWVADLKAKHEKHVVVIVGDGGKFQDGHEPLLAAFFANGEKVAEWHAETDVVQIAT